MNKMTKDELLQLTRVDVDAMVVEEGYEYAVGYLEGMLEDIRAWVERQYRVQFKNSWTWDGMVDPDDIAHEVAQEIRMELSLPLVWVARQGDIGADDIGYELTWYDGKRYGKRYVVDIGIVRKSGRWHVVLDTSEGDKPLYCIDDLMDFVTAGGE